MDVYLVIAGIVLLGLIIAQFVVTKMNIKKEVFGIPLKYALWVAIIAVSILTLIIVQSVLKSRSRLIEQLLSKLNLAKAESDIKIIDEKINDNKSHVAEIDSELENLKKDYASNQTKIDDLQKRKEEVAKSIDVMETQKQSFYDGKLSLEERVKNQKRRINNG